MNYEVIKDNIRVSLHTDTNEGWYGDYDPSDPNDQLLYRFDVDRLVDGQWEAIDDASYCTRLHSELPPEIINKALEYLAGHLVEPASQGHSIKKACEYLSWISYAWLA